MNMPFRESVHLRAKGSNTSLNDVQGQERVWIERHLYQGCIRMRVRPCHFTEGKLCL